MTDDNFNFFFNTMLFALASRISFELSFFSFLTPIVMVICVSLDMVTEMWKTRCNYKWSEKEIVHTEFRHVQSVSENLEEPLGSYKGTLDVHTSEIPRFALEKLSRFVIFK